MGFKIVWNSIVDEKADALVTPASRFPRIGRGLDSVVHEAAGPGLLKARQKLGEIGPGIVKVSKPYGLAKRIGVTHVLHALGPIYETGFRNEAFVLDTCYLHILLTAQSLGVHTVSLPVLSSGRFGFPMELAMDTAVGAIETFLRTNRGMEVKLVVVDGRFYNYALERWPGRCYKRFNAGRESAYRKSHPFVTQEQALREDGLRDNEPLEYFRGVKIRLDKRGQSFCSLFQRLWTRVKESEKRAYDEASRIRRSTGFYRYLLTNADLSERTGISPSSIKHFCSTEKAIRPAKDKVLALSVALRLDLSYAQALLTAAGHRLDDSSRDRVVADAIAGQKGDVGALNDALSAAGLNPLNVSAK